MLVGLSPPSMKRLTKFATYPAGISKHLFPEKLHSRLQICKGGIPSLLSSGMVKLSGVAASECLEALPPAFGGQSDRLIDDFMDSIDLHENPWLRTLKNLSRGAAS